MDKSKIPSAPLTASFYRTFRYHLGTLAFGSLIIAIIRMIRVMIEYIEEKLKEVGTFEVFCLLSRLINNAISAPSNFISVSPRQSISQMYALLLQMLLLLLGKIHEIFKPVRFSFIDIIISLIRCFSYILIRMSESYKIVRNPTDGATKFSHFV